TVSQTDTNPGVSTCVLTGPVSHSDCASHSDLTDGDYTLTVDGTDQAGNSAAEVTKSWTVDATAPIVDVSNVPSGTVTTKNVSPSVQETDAHPGSVSCALA